MPFDVVVSGGGPNGLMVACELALAGIDMSPCAALDVVGGGEARSPADMCDMWSSIGGCRWHADRRLAARTAPARTRGEFMEYSERRT